MKPQFLAFSVYCFKAAYSSAKRVYALGEKEGAEAMAAILQLFKGKSRGFDSCLGPEQRIVYFTFAECTESA